MKNPFQLENRTILITGASSGIGRAVAISCSNFGANLILTGRSNARLNETLKSLKSGNHKVICADLTMANDREALVEQCQEIDGLVHCAGVLDSFPIKYLTEDKLNESIETNYYSPVLLTALLARRKKFKTGTSVVFLSSITANSPLIGGTTYSGAKSAIEAFSKVLALEFASIKLRSNCILPAMVKTPMYDQAAELISNTQMEEHIKKYPLGVGYPEDVANATIFLLSDASRWISGINLVLDGGFLLRIS